VISVVASDELRLKASTGKSLEQGKTEHTVSGLLSETPSVLLVWKGKNSGRSWEMVEDQILVYCYNGRAVMTSRSLLGRSFTAIIIVCFQLSS
jgi:hypothetical protein